jgi:hypothetical protein
LKLAALISYEYSNKFSGDDRFFRAIGQIVGDSEFICTAEQLAEAVSKKGNTVYR